jgi:hypothetical protein
MLHKSHISNLALYSTDWDKARLGRFTSSRINALLTEKELTPGAMTYIYQKVGEELTQYSTAVEDQIDDENTQWGLDNEPNAIKRFQQVKKVEYLATQKLISNTDTRFASTPDAIWIHGECLNQLEYNVSTLEVKCPRKYHTYIPLYECKTPAQLFRFNSRYYWQVLDQMDNCGSAIGYFACYHPLFPSGSNFNIIEFRKIDLWEDFRKLKDRKASAVKKFNEIKAEMLRIS